MSAPVARAAAQVGKAAAKGADSHVLKKGAKRDPELYVQTPVPLELLSLLGQRASYSLVYESIANILSVYRFFSLSCPALLVLRDSTSVMSYHTADDGISIDFL
jgi:hypothetical protein